MSIHTYSPSDVDLYIDGYKMTGWLSVNVKREKDSYTLISGIRGKNTRVRNYDKSATISIDLLQTSETNDILTEIHRQDTAEDSGETSTADNARLVITLRDKSGTSEFRTEDAFIVGYPEQKFSQDFEARSWVIKCLSTNVFKVGGNLRPTTALLDSIFNKVFK